MDSEHILRQAVTENASDILLVAGLPVSLKKNSVIQREPGSPLTPEDTYTRMAEIYELAGRSMDTLLSTGDDDFSFSLPGLSRFRVNAMKQRGSLAAVIRVVSFHLPDRLALHLPDEVMAFTQHTKGLVLVSGPAGCGKSTTLACMIDAINHTRRDHIITIEDPIEFLHRHDKSVVTQREVAGDTLSYETALRAAMRQAPDVILLGEMRDYETMKAALTAAETGHLVISTLHTLGAVNTIDRIVDSFPAAQQPQVRVQLAMVLKGVISQQLIPTADGTGLIPAFEIMVANHAVRSMIRESRAHQLESVIFSASSEGMTTMDNSLLQLVSQGRITAENALYYCSNSELLQTRLSQEGLLP